MRQVPHHAGSRGRVMQLFACALATALMLSGCGGGGGSSSPANNQQQAQAASAQGSVLLGLTEGATIRIYEVQANGQLRLLAQTVTNANGRFTLPSSIQIGTLLLIEANGGRYVNEMSGASEVLDTPLRAVGFYSGPTQRWNLTAFSEVATRHLIEEIPMVQWTSRTQDIRDRLDGMAAALGLNSLIDHSPVDLVTANGWETAEQSDDIQASFLAGSYEGFRARLNLGTHRAGLDQLYKLLVADGDDDILANAFQAGSVNFVDRTTFPSEDKRRMRSEILTGLPNASDAELAAAVPQGESSGQGTASMPRFGLVMLTGTPEAITTLSDPFFFNQRGALIAYKVSGGENLFRYLKTSSVAEVHADGIAAIGRWNGGGTALIENLGEDGSRVRALGNTVNRHVTYAIGQPVAVPPTCGVRRYRLTAQTKPVVETGTTANTTLEGIEIPTGQASVSFINGQARWQWGLTLKLKDSSTVSLGQPHLPASTGDLIQDVRQPFRVDTYGVHRVSGHAMIAGGDASRIVMNLMYEASSPVYRQERLAVVLVSDTPLDTSACEPNAGSNGLSALSPLPTDGTHAAGGLAFLPGAPLSLNWGAQVNFSSRGTPANVVNQTGALTIGDTQGVLELQGDAELQIGRISGVVSVDGTNLGRREVPYFVGKASTNLPTTGVVRYTLSRSTSALLFPLGSSSPLPTRGQIDEVVLEVDFGNGQGWAHVGVSVTGRFDGKAFSVSLPLSAWNTTSLSLIRSVASISHESLEGVITGASADRAGLVLNLPLGEARIRAAVILNRAN